MDNHPPQFGPPEKLGRMVVEIPALCRSVSYENHMAFIFPPGLCCSLALVDPAGWTSWFIRRLYIIIQQSDWLYWESFAIICIYGIYSCSSNIFTWLATVNPSCHIGHRHVMVVMVGSRKFPWMFCRASRALLKRDMSRATKGDEGRRAQGSDPKCTDNADVKKMSCK